MAAVAAAPNPTKGYATVTLSVTGGSATTAYTVVVVTPSGHTSTYPVVTDGAGAATCRHVPSNNGTYQVNVYQTVQVSVATTTFNSSGSST